MAPAVLHCRPRAEMRTLHLCETPVILGMRSGTPATVRAKWMVEGKYRPLFNQLITSKRVTAF